jgi:hypothetical protein
MKFGEYMAEYRIGKPDYIYMFKHFQNKAKEEKLPITVNFKRLKKQMKLNYLSGSEPSKLKNKIEKLLKDCGLIIKSSNQNGTILNIEADIFGSTYKVKYHEG